VARNGPEFEQRIKQKEHSNPRFNFLNSGDPYNAYYQHRVDELAEGGEKQGDSDKPALAQDSSAPSLAKGPQATGQSEAVKQRQSDILKSVGVGKEGLDSLQEAAPVLKDPPADFEFIADPPSISAFDLDVVKLTAQFVARNGRQFLTNLMQREQRNYQFDFLRPQHSLFQYFTKLLEQYTKVLIPPKDLMKKLSDEGNSEKKILEQVRYRVAWIKHQEAKRRKEEEAKERERVSYAQIDWHGFVVVETVDYQPWEVGNFPPPTNPTEVGARVLQQRRVESTPSGGKKKKPGDDDDEGERKKGANTNVEDMDEDSSDEDESDLEGEPGDAAPAALGKAVASAPASNTQAIPALPTPGNIEVRQYDPKTANPQQKKKFAETEEYLVSPITGERVPASKVGEHMRIGLLDPRWVEERDKQITKQTMEDAVFAAGTSIESQLRNLAERRTDIFGPDGGETDIGRKVGETDEDMAAAGGKVTWDGHSSTADAAAKQARQNISLEEQIAQIHRQKGLIAAKDAIGPSGAPNKMPPPPSMGSVPPPQQMAPPPARTIPAPAPPPPAPVVMAPAPPVTLIRPPPPPMVVPGPPPPQAFFNAPQLAPMGGFSGMPGMPQPRAPPPMAGSGANLVPLGQPGPPPPAVVAAPPPVMAVEEMDEGPASKRARGEDSLIPEQEFLARNPPQVAFKIMVPTDGSKPEWNLNGQVLDMTLSLRDPVSAIKAKIAEDTGMPPGKQKLRMETIFFKDSNSLAYYNISPTTLVYLEVKQRGGRK